MVIDKCLEHNLTYVTGRKNVIVHKCTWAQNSCLVTVGTIRETEGRQVEDGGHHNCLCQPIYVLKLPCDYFGFQLLDRQKGA